MEFELEPAILEAQADFGLKLLRQVCRTKGAEQQQHSTILSPISVAVSLAMSYAGAKGETAEELGKVLANGAPESEIHANFGAFVRAFQSKDAKASLFTLELANRVYAQSGFDVLDTFQSAMERHYAGQFQLVDFRQREETANAINQFVESATHDKIKNLADPKMFDSLTRIVLVNAIYFKSNWKNKFCPQKTTLKPFYVCAGEQKQLYMMHETDYYRYYENDELQVLGIPYVGRDVFMYVLLPKDRFGLSECLSSLDGKTLLGLIHHCRCYNTSVKVQLPKFKMESVHALVEPLQSLGVRTAFDPDRANFTGISDDPQQRLVVSRVVQKAFIEVNEEGTEAAAATFASYSCCSGRERPTPPKSFVADRPFALFIVVGRSEVLFNGLFHG